MNNRYQRALATGGPDKYRAVVKEDTELLSSFGLQLTSVEGGGIMTAVESELKGARINPWNLLGFDMKAWNWLRPILLELREARGQVTERLAAK